MAFLRSTPLALGLAFLAASAPSQPKYTDWSAPVNLGPDVNSPAADFGPALSKDGLELYFASDRPGGAGGVDLWVCQRSDKRASWSAAENIGPGINTEFTEGPPTLSRDGHWLIFNSDRNGGAGMNDLWVSYRKHKHDPFGWETPFNLGDVNTAFQDQGASWFANDDGQGPQLFFASTRPGGPGLNDIYVAELLPGGWSSTEPALVPELSSTSNDQRPSVRFDGLELFFFSDRPGSQGFDLWVAVRDAVTAPWGAPENLGPVVNSAANDQNPHIAADRESLYFASNRLATARQDLYVSTRTRTRSK
jgi:hypothetical protein